MKNHIQELPMPMAFVHEARLRIYKPARRPTAQDQTEVIETSYGKLVLEHRTVQDKIDPKKFKLRPLGLGHADLIDAMRLTAIDQFFDGSGRLVLLIDPSKARAAGGFKCSLRDLEKMLDDLAGALIKIVEPASLEATGHLIDTWRKASDATGQISLPCPLSRTKRYGHGSRATRALWQVTFGDVGMILLKNDLPVQFDLVKISALRFGVSQAAARWLLGQSRGKQPQGGWKVDTVIKAVAGTLGSEDFRHRRHEISRDLEGLEVLGIQIKSGRIWLQSVQPTPEERATHA